MVFNGKQSRALGLSAAVAALALAACSGGGGSPTPTGSATPTATTTPAPTVSGVVSTPAAATIGVAYLPDGGNGNGFTGLQLAHFEDTNGNLLPTTVAATPQPLVLAGAVGPFSISSDGTVAIAAVSRNGQPNYTIVQSLLGVNTGAAVPVGTGYDVTQLPTPAPNTTPTPGVTATPLPSPLPVLSAITSLSIYGNVNSGQAPVGVVAGPDTTGFLGMTQLANPGPVYGGFVSFAGQTPAPITASRPHLAALLTSTSSTELLRGPSDLLAYAIAVGGSGYTFAIGGEDSTLGLTATTYGSGVMAISPLDGSHALIGQTNPGDGSANGLTLVEGLPGKILKNSTITLASPARSIAITSGGTYAVVGTDLGFYVISGIQSGTLALAASFAPVNAGSNLNAPTYVGCDGKTYTLANVRSVGFSADLQYLAALGNAPAANCAQSRTASLVVIPFNQTTGTAPTAAPSPAASTTPAPAMFVQNNIIAPTAGQDYMYVR